MLEFSANQVYGNLQLLLSHGMQRMRPQLWGNNNTFLHLGGVDMHNDACKRLGDLRHYYRFLRLSRVIFLRGYLEWRVRSPKIVLLCMKVSEKKAFESMDNDG